MADVSADLLRQNNWGEGDKIQYLGWLTRAGIRAESSVLIEFTSPVVANRAIITGVVWGKQIHNASRFCREGRMKLCRKCSKPGHIQSHCSNVFKCGHCAGEHPTWECPSARGQTIPVKCANCGVGHRPVSRDCPVKITAMNEAKQALADCPIYHRIPLHFRNTTNGNTLTPPKRPDPAEVVDLDLSIHAPGAPQGARISQRTQQVIIDLEPESTETGTSLEELLKSSKPRKGPGRPKGSRTRPKDQARPPPGQTNTIISTIQRSTRSHAASQTAAQEHTISKKRRMGEPEDVIDEQPDHGNWCDIQLSQADLLQGNLRQDTLEEELTQFTNDVTTINDTNNTPEPRLEDLDPESPEYQKLITLKYNRMQAVPVRSSPPAITTDAPTIEDLTDDVWHEASERIVVSDGYVPQGQEGLSGGHRHGAGAVEKQQQHTTHQPATAAFQLVYPAKETPREMDQNGDQEQDPDRHQPGVCLFVSRKIDPGSWSCQLISQDYQLLKLRRAQPGKHWTDLFVHNVYNRPSSNTLAQLRGELARRPLAEHIVLGYMNAHHITWGGIGIIADNEAEQLLEITDERGLELITETGRATWSRNDQSSVIDLTFISSSLFNQLVNCERADDIEHSSDHFPIRTVLDIETPVLVQQKRRNWNATDDNKLIQKAEEDLKAKDLSQAGPPQIEAQCQKLLDTVQSAIEASTPNRNGAYEKGLTPSLKIQGLQSPGQLAETVEQKANAFRAAFFPQPPPADLSDTVSFQYPQPIEFPPITAQEIQEAVRTAKAGKAPGEDGIPNSLWHKLIEVPVILQVLGQLFDACVRTGYNPTNFQRSITVVLRKRAKSYYQLAKSYRPVAWLNTLGKFLEAVVARRISYAVETMGLLPKTHLGGRRGISTDHAIHNMIDRIKMAWGKGKPVVSLLMQDVSGAYDNVSHDRLLHNLRKRRLGQLAPWVKTFLSNQSTRIHLIENCGNGVTSNGWVDDVCFMAKGDSERETTKKLRMARRKADQWARTHASVFDPKKYALVHFVNTREIDPQYTPLSIQGYTVPATRTAERYLGYWLDPGLEFHHHREKAVAKAGVSLQALRSLAGSTWGGSLSAMRRIYQAVVIPKTKARTISQPFAGIQKRAACLISGAFRTTAAEALNTELYLPPAAIHMDRLVKETALRLRTGSAFAVPPTMLRRQPNDERDWAGWTPMEAQAWKTGGCLTAPPGTLTRHWESRKAFVQAPWQAPPEVIIEDREVAVKRYDQILAIGWRERPVILYTDGSGIEGRIGAAAIVDLEDQHAHSQMGDENTSTVYAAELRAIEMALALVLESTEPWAEQAKNRLIIFADSQAALKALGRPRMPSGQVYLAGCLELIRQLADKGIRTELRWIPAHQGVIGNEIVDQQAKEAAQKPDGPLKPDNRYIYLAAAAKRRIRNEAKLEWERTWEKETTSRPTRRLIETPTKKTLEYWPGLRKATVSILMQLRTGRISLSAYLSRINRRESARCGCNLGNQTVAHVLLECPLHQDERDRMRSALSDQGIALCRDELLTRLEARNIATEFMVSTGLLGQFQTVDPTALGVEEGDDKGAEIMIP
ncbi:zinc knuckle domain protein [Penicillium atrosanguineum]|uniref:Zinc knuckle domain protein n=1 Tax=Penicillium atrosanguineum TaxID=1132637 RepID=A0A9W9QC69_9EURO|nr:zinc knuckle domain protein [Penicillium atrosanguineum]